MKNKSQKGFTLVEMIVSLGIFSVVAVVALGALMKIMTANQKAQTLQSAMTNINFALEAMSREIRTGYNYNCTTRSPSEIYYYSDNNFGKRGCEANNYAVYGSGYATVIAFMSSRTSTTGVGAPCNLATVYRFYNSSGSIKLQKAEQSTCGAAVGTISGSDFVDVISPSNIVISDYIVTVGPSDSWGNISEPFPIVNINIIGYAGEGNKEKTKTSFGIQTTVSSRVSQ